MQKAFNWLNQQGISYTFNDYKKQGITPELLQSWIKLVGLDAIVNKQGLTYKKLSDEEKKLVQQEKTAIALLVEKTSIIKRPIVAYNNNLLIGFNENEWKITLKA